MFRLHTAQRPFLLPTGRTYGGEVVHDGDVKVPLLLLMESESTVFSSIMRSVPFVPEQRLYFFAKHLDLLQLIMWWRFFRHTLLLESIKF